MNKPKLERCPHCEGAAGLEDWTCAYESGTTIRCAECGACVSENIEGGAGWHDRAVEKWNRRAPLPDNKALTVEELREAADCGNPVWLVGVGTKDQWVRIDYVESLTIGFSAFCDAETWSIYTERYGKVVFAYRRPPEKGDL